MSDGHLLLIALGPVQDFIAQARRTRDLWFGSHLLSELSRAAAKALAEANAKLIFPALLRGNDELKPCDEPTRKTTGNPPLAISNKVLAEFDGVNPAGCAAVVREAVRGRWTEIAERARKVASDAKLLAEDCRPVWEDQVDEVLEFYAAWAPLSAGYKAARKQVEQALAGRKNLRDFRAWREDRPGAPKSSLDGARVSVLPKQDDRRGDFARWRINPGEQLDAVGIIKRVGFKPDQFVPVVNVAAGRWLAAARDKPALRALKQACEGVIPLVVRDLPVVKQFGFDASVLYPSRWPALFEELEQNGKLIKTRPEIEAAVRALLDAMKGREPPAYVACIRADGDNMGKALDELEDAGQNRQFSEALAQFPTQARAIIQSADHLGSLVFAGGDDVLAFVPVGSALACVQQLRDSFDIVMKQAAGRNIPRDKWPTLSVGIGIVYAMEQMDVQLTLARDAERKAKDAGKNALSVIVDKRSGGRREFVMRWTDDPQQRLNEDLKLFEHGLSGSKIYALEKLLRRFPKPDQVDPPADNAKALYHYANDLLRHGTESESAVSLTDLGIPSIDIEYPLLRDMMQRTIDRLLIARGLREEAPQ